MIESHGPTPKPTKRVARKKVAVLVLFEAGITNLAIIAEAVGLPIEEVERIESASDPVIRELALRRVSTDDVFHLRNNIACPRCRAIINIVPCVACRAIHSMRGTS